MTESAFDFRQPPPTTLESRTTQWLQEACTLIPRTWGRLLPFAAELAVDRVKSVSAAAGIESLPMGAIAFRLAIDLNPDFAPLIALSRPLLIALINGSLGAPPDQLPPDRELSTVERSLCDFLLAQLILDVLSDGWPSSERPKFRVVVRGEPRGVNLLPANDLVLLATLTVKGPFGDHPIYLILPRTAPIADLVKPVVEVVAAMPPESRAQVEELVRDMAVDVTVTLGDTQITMMQLAMLRPGDIVVLEQKISDPLAAKVAGKDKYSVWPGAVGRRQAVQVDTLVEA